MPPRTVASPKKKKLKRKGSDASKSALKKSRVAEPCSTPLVSLRLTDADAASSDAPRRSGRSTAGTGGRNSQLEKIGTLLEAPSGTHKPKGSTSLGPDIPVNPQAPGPPRHRGRGNRSNVAPPPYNSNVPDTAHMNVSTAESLQPPSFTLRQPGGRFGFATHPPIVPPEPDLSNPYVAVGRTVAKNRSQNIVTGLTAAHSVAPATTGFLARNLDPALCDGTERQLTGDHSSTDDEEEEGEEEEEEDNEDKDDDEGEREREMRQEQFGWGEVGRRHSEHPGFSGENLPSQIRVARPLTPDFDFQFSRDEDDIVAQKSVNEISGVAGSATRPEIESQPTSSIQWYDGSQDLPDTLPGTQQRRPQNTQIITSKPDDVLKRHHKKNGQPRLPNPETLELLHQVAESGGDVQAQRSQTKASKKSSDGPKPTQLAWYGPCWKSFLEDAKGECRAQHALENPFPALVNDLPASVTEVLLSVLVVWDADGKLFEPGVWPGQKPNMARLLYDDLATWRSDLKKTAISIAPLSYSLIPSAHSVPPQECAAWVEGAAAGLIAGSLFLRFGVDEMGKTKNFAHPALRDGAISFFYTGPYRIAQRRPEIFRKQLPVSCLALICTAFNCVLDGFAKNGHGKSFPKFTAKEYGPIYRRILAMIKEVLNDAYHGPRLSTQLREWAEAGWIESLKLDGAVEARNDHLQIVLD